MQVAASKNGDPKDKAQAELAKSGIEPGQVFMHSKTGGLYSIVATAIDEATLAPLVVYRSNAKGTTWVRTLANFREEVPTVVDGSVRHPRFARMQG